MHYTTSGVNIRLLPSHKCSFEDPVHVTVSGLNPQQRVDLRSKLTDDTGRVFQASATYQADGSGQVDLNRDPSLGGSFTGVEPMGLFWALKSDTVACRFTLTDVTRPALFDIEVVSDDKVIAKVTNERHCLADGVRRIPVTEGRIRGTLFMPPGKGPFPGILDTYVFRGGPFELRAALLAKRGFAVLALAFQGYQDLPKRADKFHLEYFEEGIDFLRQQPEVKDQKIGLVSISKSGDLALSMATFLPGISATVWINGCNANTLVPIYYKDICVPPLLFDVNRIKMTPLGFADIGDAMNDPMSEEGLPSVIPIERAPGSFMFIMSEADRNWQSAYYARLACDRLKSHGKNNYELVRNTLAKMHFTTSGVNIRLLPSYKCSFEDPVQVTVSGLNPQQRVDLRSKLTDDTGRVFQASATYQADGSGQVDLNRDPSLGGSFAGVEPMGLFWALKADIVACKFTLTDVTRPALVDIEVVSDDKVIAKVTNERHCLADGVRRIPVTEGRIRGTLFMPPGKGPFPGILDTNVFRGFPFELRAALLAKRGFAVLALAFQGYQDLPKRADKFHLEYFEEGIDFLRQQPEVKDQKIGLVSISKSGDLALSMATFLPGISATVWINGCNANTLVPIYYKDICVPPLLYDIKKAKMTPLGFMDIGDVTNDPMSEEGLPSVIPIERAPGSFMFIMSEADRNWQSAYYAKLACDRLKAHGKSNYELFVSGAVLAKNRLNPDLWFKFSGASRRRRDGRMR
ncbi:acyl-coenzyme A thioesterase 1-like protein [Labeo rohita]|uniref:Acyl-coenzyme A thioesterase 1-like protein n=2 Tax=Labeo rohita TaxID=84645 RepID=A0A498MC88_LABRO|nr:acyl-coenzyme A thioesterase 1-like protein [Labeo rohita]